MELEVTFASHRTWLRADSLWEVTDVAWNGYTLGTWYKVGLEDEFHLLDEGDIVNGYKRKFIESIRFAESYVDYISFFSHFLENLSISEKKKEELSKQVSELISLLDKANTVKAKVIKEVLRVTDKIRNTKEYNRNIQESLNIISTVMKENKITPKEALSIFDEMLQKPNAVISDLIFSLVDKNIPIDSPVGYEEFVPFLSGDYDYQAALFKTVIQTEDVSNKGIVSSFCINVDLPDIQDSGTTNVKHIAVIPFNRSFFREPEVTITMRASKGVMCFPTITEVTRENFTVELTDMNGSPVEGTISWTALGC